MVIINFFIATPTRCPCSIDRSDSHPTNCDALFLLFASFLTVRMVLDVPFVTPLVLTFVLWSSGHWISSQSIGVVRAFSGLGAD